MKYFLVSLLVLLLVTCNSHEDNSAIRGYVKDSNGNPIQNAKIVLNLSWPISSGKTTIQYMLPQASPVKLWVEEECSGDTVRVLVDANQTEGSYSIYWDGRNGDGLVIKDGLYHFHYDTDSLVNSFAHINVVDYEVRSFDEIEPYTYSDDDGYFEIDQSCLPFGYEENYTDVNGNITGKMVVPRSIVVRALQSDLLRGASDTLRVDQSDGVETTIRVQNFIPNNLEPSRSSRAKAGESLVR